VSRSLRLWGPVAAWMAVIFALSSRPLPPSAGVFPDWFTHGAAYAALCILACRALAGGLGPALRGRDAALAVSLCAVYGVATEFHQRYVPGRQGDPADVAKDVAGALVGVWFYRRVLLPRAGFHEREAHRG
jgi:VanZ family protein